MTKITLKNKVKQIIAILNEKYPEPKCALEHITPWQLLVATILSAQCTDKRVNMITPALFKKFPTIESFAKADIKELEVLFGYESGGISPIPISNKIQSFLDRKIQLEDNIFCGFGSKNKIMEIKGNDLISLSTDIFDISKS